MNEIQILQTQLATEQAHFAEVAAACARAQSAGAPPAAGDFLPACTDYFELAVRRFEPEAGRTLASQLAAGGPSPAFLAAFAVVARTHFDELGEMRTRNLPVAQWRARARIDADSIFAERTCYARVKASIPT